MTGSANATVPQDFPIQAAENEGMPSRLETLPRSRSRHVAGQI
jgi:hypothetical protein